MDIDINELSSEQQDQIASYKRINERLEVLQRQMAIIQHEAKCLIEELEDLRNNEKNKLRNGKK
jgi:septation ring formation regulator EzrA